MVVRLKSLLAAPADDVATLAARLGRLIGAAAPATAADTLSIIRAAIGNTVHMVEVDHVCYFQATDNYTSVVTANAEMLIRFPLKDLLAQLPADRFRQIHRGTIVNLREVAAATRDDNGRLSLRLKQRNEALAVSRVFAEQFRQM